MIYKLLLADSAYKLSDMVTDFLGDGWQLYGSPCMTSLKGGSGEEYCQAVTKE